MDIWVNISIICNKIIRLVKRESESDAPLRRTSVLDDAVVDREYPLAVCLSILNLPRVSSKLLPGWLLSCTCTRFLPPFQQLFQYQRPIVFLIVRGINQGDSAFLTLLLQQLDGVLFFLEFRPITLLELFPSFWIVIEPLAQLRTRRNVFEPQIHGGSLLAETSRPEPLYQNTAAIRRRRFFVHALQIEHRKPPSRRPISGRQTALEVSWAEWSRLGDQLPGRIYLLPHIPQQHAAHPAIPQVVDHPFSMQLLPIGHRLQPGVHFAHRLVAQVE